MKRNMTWIFALLGMCVLILDAGTAFVGARNGIEVCLQTVIPSLFPFFVCSILLKGALSGKKMTLFSPIAKQLRIPMQAMPLMLIGLLGGYPVGAQAVAQAYRDGQLRRNDATRMLAFCSQAGPAFIFGMGVRLFPAVWMCFVVWFIHILSAWIVSCLTPGMPTQSVIHPTQRVLSLPQALRKAIEVLATVCGWVILFRVCIAFADRWFLWTAPKDVRTAIIGFLELANGTCDLLETDRLGLRLTLFCVLLSFGGLCVAMQTASVCQGLSTKPYLAGKACQAALSLLLSIPAQWLLPQQDRWLPAVTQIVLCCTVCVLYRFFAGKAQKSSSILCEAAV